MRQRVSCPVQDRIAKDSLKVHDVAVVNITTEPKPDLPAKLISELVSDPDFPNSALGKKVDIKGYTGIIVGVVKNSIKVRSAEGNTVSYNFNVLRKLYGPRTAPEPAPIPPAPATPPAAQPQPKRAVILEPNFESALVPVERLVGRSDFPSCAFGVFIDLHGFSGVVVELAGCSLKVRSREGSTCSYNADGLRKIYASPDISYPRTGSH
jgi:hypothetical protein